MAIRPWRTLRIPSWSFKCAMSYLVSKKLSVIINVNIRRSLWYNGDKLLFPFLISPCVFIDALVFGYVPMYPSARSDMDWNAFLKNEQTNFGSVPVISNLVPLVYASTDMSADIVNGDLCCPCSCFWIPAFLIFSQFSCKYHRIY